MKIFYHSRKLLLFVIKGMVLELPVIATQKLHSVTTVGMLQFRL